MGVKLLSWQVRSASLSSIAGSKLSSRTFLAISFALLVAHMSTLLFFVAFYLYFSSGSFEKGPNASLIKGLMACQGSKTCAFGVIENKPDAIKLASYLSERLPREEPIRMHWSGCAKGCGQHSVGDIGFVGTKVKINGEVKLAVDVFLGGEKVGTVPLDELHVYVERLLKEGAL